MTFRMHSFFSLAINSDLCVMDGVTIKRYSFNVPSTIGIEAKSLDFLWEKAPLTEGIHRTDFLPSYLGGTGRTFSDGRF